ncbi:MAG TPA: hypothetical protein VMV75_03830 [Sulfuricella sp.]|nr:hypothetical protein [Sulfuricella sp.]
MSQPEEAIASENQIPPAGQDASGGNGTGDKTDLQQALEQSDEIAEKIVRQHNHERRELPRKIVNWHATIAINTPSGETSVPILIRDVSAEDFDVECKFNLSSTKPVLVTVALPPRNPHGPPEIIQLTVSMPSAILSHDAFCFRMPFVKFHGKAREALSRFLPGGKDSMF